jgi:hypothetical protein
LLYTKILKFFYQISTMRLCTDLFVDVEHFAISTNDKRPAEGYGAFVCNDSVSSCCVLFRIT